MTTATPERGGSPRRLTLAPASGTLAALPGGFHLTCASAILTLLLGLGDGATPSATLDRCFATGGDRLETASAVQAPKAKAPKGGGKKPPRPKPR